MNAKSNECSRGLFSLHYFNVKSVHARAYNFAVRFSVSTNQEQAALWACPPGSLAWDHDIPEPKVVSLRLHWCFSWSKSYGTHNYGWESCVPRNQTLDAIWFFWCACLFRISQKHADERARRSVSYDLNPQKLSRSATCSVCLSLLFLTYSNSRELSSRSR
jgi:hypothetical protein